MSSVLAIAFNGAKKIIRCDWQSSYNKVVDTHGLSCIFELPDTCQCYFIAQLLVKVLSPLIKHLVSKGEFPEGKIEWGVCFHQYIHYVSFYLSTANLFQLFLLL